MRFLSKPELRPWFEGKSVAIVGSGPGVLGNKPGFVDGHDVVVRVNNYRLSEAAGHRTDVFYSFFGNSILKTTSELQKDGVKLCLCKCPDAHVIESKWHRRKNKMIGVDYRYIYEQREKWWFCDTYIPAAEEFLDTFKLLVRHIPTTGFSAILAVLDQKPREVHLTGFDFFRSRKHNVSDPWVAKNDDDPFRHEPERERMWLAENWHKHPLSADDTLAALIDGAVAA